MNISEAFRHERVFAPAFQPFKTWSAWTTILKAAEGLSLDSDESALFAELSGGREAPKLPVRELVVVAGRRAGKSRIASLIAVHRAMFIRYDDLAIGEVPTVMLLSEGRRQARVLVDYVGALLRSTPVLEERIIREGAEALEVRGLGDQTVRIEVHSSNYRSVRGYTLVCVVMDEIGYWHDDTTANPDSEVVAAVRPAMASVSNALLVAISSPYARKGWLWQEHQRHYGRNSRQSLIIQAGSLTLNPSLDGDFVNEQYRADRSRAAAEYGGEFRSDIESFINLDSLEANIVPGRRELPPQDRFFGTYQAFCDPSGGRADSFTVAIGHRDEQGIAVVDVLREIVAPFSPRDAVEEYANLLKRYGVEWVVGDAFAGEWPREAFREAGVDYETSKLPRSGLYLEFLATTNSGQVELLDHPKTVAQLCALERRTTRGGRETVDHGPGGHDDLANAVAGVTFQVLTSREFGDLGITV